MEYTKEELERVANAIEDELHGRDVEDPSIIAKWLDTPEKRAILEPYLKSQEARQCLWAAGPLEGCDVLDFAERAEVVKATKMAEQARQDMLDSADWGPPEKAIDDQWFRVLVANAIALTDSLRYYLTHTVLEEADSQAYYKAGRDWMPGTVKEMIDHEEAVLELLCKVLESLEDQ